MDQDLMLLLTKPSPSNAQQESPPIEVIDPATGEIEIKHPDGAVRYTLKPLDALFGQGYGATTLDPQDQRFQPLLLSIEQSIANCYRDNPKLSDGQVLLTLKQLVMNPAANCGNDPGGQAIQARLRLFLSANDHSKQEVKLALRKVMQSVERHTKLAGPKGYLSFIVQYV